MNIPNRKRGFNPDNQHCSILGAVAGSVVGGLLGKSSADKASKRSRDASRYATDEQKRQYDLTRGDLMPYMDAGTTALGQYTNAMNKHSPFYNAFAGGADVPQYTNQVGEFQFNLENDPIYQFQRDEALEAATRGANAGGMQLSGNLLSALQKTAAGEAGKYQDAAFRRQLATSDTNYNRGAMDWKNAMLGHTAQYGQDVSDYNLGVARNQDMYGRSQDYLNRLAGLSASGQNAAAGLGGLGANMASNIGNIAMSNAATQGSLGMAGANAINNAIQSSIDAYTFNNALDRMYPSGWNRSPF